ncbi:hypothetical protein BDFB_014784 [Asbolus verrucosus]|uniref:Uncharacterized protein n=1 Tax=Asbolus verrucosus TaxID=1661398 RepID=A0A482WDI6_ASBVE|nr:hypothetical protein BDFB_014784 [Asbolus verrucosus]
MPNTLLTMKSSIIFSAIPTTALFPQLIN